MEEIIVISSTNRANSNTLKVSRIYEKILIDQHIKCKLLDFQNLPQTIAFSETFGKRSTVYSELLVNFVESKNKFIFVVPEYNGSFPGILKLFLDSMHPREWADKKVCLVGVADGRAGNIRGMEHLTGIMHYLKMHVYYNKLPISQVNKLLNEQGLFNDPNQQKACEAQVQGFINF